MTVVREYLIRRDILVGYVEPLTATAHVLHVLSRVSLGRAREAGIRTFSLCGAHFKANWALSLAWNFDWHIECLLAWIILRLLRKARYA